MWPKAVRGFTDMFVNCRNLSRLLLVIVGVFFLLVPPQTAGAQTAGAGDAELCDGAGADPDAGIPACTRLLEHPSAETKVPAVYNQRGVAKVRGGYNLDDAIADFTSALNKNPKFVDAWKNRGLARKMQDNYKGAFDDFNQAIRLNGRSPDLYNLRGSALLDKQAFNSAIADFGKAIALDSNYTKAYVNRGLALLYTRQLDRAIADFNVVVHLAPSDPRGYMDRAMARMEKGDFKGTIDDYN